MQHPRRARSPILLLALGCACATQGPESLPAYALRDRHAAIEIGQSRPAVATLMGGLPVRRPGHPEAPFPTPLRSAEWVAPGGERIRLEVYVIAARPVEGCPDVQYDDAPVAFVDDRVAGKTWDFVEWRWRAWGGDLARLRALQDRFVCDFEPTPAE